MNGKNQTRVLFQARQISANNLEQIGLSLEFYKQVIYSCLGK